MRALTVEAGVPGSARLEELPAPRRGGAEAEIAPLLVGICGTDAEILDGGHGSAPPGASRLVIGHEAVARVVGAPAGGPLSPGALVVPIVRRPDPVPCPNCAVGEWDMCSNGRYLEHGIEGLHGFLAERAVVGADAVVPVPEALGDLAVLVEPTSVVAKAWEQIERIGSRATWQPSTVLVTGAGPIGLLAALLGRQRGLEVHVLDRVTAGPKPGLVAHLGAGYHTGTVAEACAAPDIVIECTGVGALVFDAMRQTGPNGIVCLTGISSGTRRIDVAGARLNRRLVLENDVVFGTVNANRRHYEAAVAALAAADHDWLARLVTRRVPLERWRDALEKAPDDVKVTVAIG